MDSINNACKFGSDAWLELQAFKTRQLNRREKLNRHKNLNQDLIAGIAISQNNNNPTSQHLQSSSLTSSNNLSIPSKNTTTTTTSPPPTSSLSFTLSLSSTSTLDSSIRKRSTTTSSCNTSTSDNLDNDGIIINNNLNYSNNVYEDSNNQLEQHLEQLQSNHVNLELVECLLILKLCDVALKLPIDSKSLSRSISKIRGLEGTSQSLIENLLQKFAHQELITIEEPTEILIRRSQQIIALNGSNSTHNNDDVDDCQIYVTSADHTKLVEFDKSFGSLNNIRALLLESKSNEDNNNTTIACQEDGVDLMKSAVSIQTARSSNHHHHHHQNNNSLVDNNSLCLTKDAFRESNRKLLLGNSDTVDGQVAGSSTSFDTLNPLASKSTASSKRKQFGDDVESLLSLSSTKERENKKLGEELLELLSKPTAKERNLLESFRSADGYRVQEFCPKGTKGECKRFNEDGRICDKLHFKKIIAKHTEESLGDCSFLNTCFHMDSCKYVHYEVDYDDKQQQAQFKRPHPAEPMSLSSSSSSSSSLNKLIQRQDCNSNSTVGTADNQHKTPTSNSSISSACSSTSSSSSSSTNNHLNKDSNNNRSLLMIPKHSISQTNTSNNANPITGNTVYDNNSSLFTLSAEEQARIDAKNRKRFKTVLYPPQWIQCDLRFFDMSLLGKFSVVMADPPWDIHMELPYGTMSDDEMRKLNIPALQDEGVIFLWVTGRAMELGRECLSLWGYERCDEIIWVKTNQLQRIIRTGRTGHWLNHGKEHCLVGVKGNPKDINRGLDCDVIVAEVRATSHKPDEIYGIIERLSPGTRKIELFGRAHNVQPNWITLGNQLNGVRLVEPSLVNAFKKLNLPFQTTADNVG